METENQALLSQVLQKSTSPDLDLLSRLPLEAQKRAMLLVRGLNKRKAQSLFFEMYPETDTVWKGPTILQGLMENGQTIFAREKYPKHLEWMDAGSNYRERCAMFGNRTGKTFGCGGYEMAAHLTGLYPDWWTGKRFDVPISAWAAGKSYETTRDILQLTLLGEVSYTGTNNGSRKGFDGRGMIPGNRLSRNSWRSGVADLADTILVRHTSGANSFLGFKSYDQGRKAFEGTGRHVIWFDEEPPEDVYNEALIRTATVNGITMITFTPLLGMSKVVLSFMPADQRPDIR